MLGNHLLSHKQSFYRFPWIGHPERGFNLPVLSKLVLLPSIDKMKKLPPANAVTRQPELKVNDSAIWIPSWTSESFTRFADKKNEKSG
jgi:hypothetical protein